MILSLTRSIYIFAVLLSAAVLASCGGGGGGAGTGTLNLSLTDAPDGDYSAVYVTINEVWVKHEEKNWEMLNGPDLKLPQTLNLLDFVNGARAQLGIVELEVGHYNQMRLIVEDSTGVPQSQDLNILGNTHPFFNYVIDSADNEIFLKVPSGGNTGIKTDGFNIESDVPKDIVLDFDANKSVHAHSAGKNAEWRLRPTIKVVEVNNLVSGVVDEPGAEDDSGAWVTAQLYDADAGVGSKDEVFSVAGVSSMINGTYLIHLPINTSGTPYNIVAVKDGFLPECQALDSAASREYTDVNFVLTPSATGTISGSILNLPAPPSAEDSYSVFLSIRKFVDCDGNDVPETLIEVAYKPYANVTGDPIDYGPITLAEGEYELVAWADGIGTLYPPLDITIEGDITQDVDFGPSP